MRINTWWFFKLCYRPQMMIVHRPTAVAITAAAAKAAVIQWLLWMTDFRYHGSHRLCFDASAPDSCWKPCSFGSMFWIITLADAQSRVSLLLSVFNRIKLAATSDGHRHADGSRCVFIKPEGVTKTVRYRLPSDRPREQLSGRCENTKSCSPLSAPLLSLLTPTPPLTPYSPSLALMNEVFSQWCQSCAALTHGACEEKWQDAALSPHLSTRPNTWGPAPLSAT